MAPLGVDPEPGRSAANPSRPQNGFGCAPGGEPEMCRRLRDLLTGKEPRITFMRLALTPVQAVGLDLLDADGKAEADSVPLLIMNRWLTEAIEALTDPARWEEHEQAQESEA